MKVSALFVSFFLIIAALSAARGQGCLGDWCEPDTEVNGWSYSPQLGWVYDPFCPWVYIDARGWFYVDEASMVDGQLWLYNNSNGWFYTTQSVFPYLYSDLVGEWLLYDALTLTLATVQSGGNFQPTPLPGAEVTLYFSSNIEAPEVLATWTTDTNGQFSFSTPILTEQGAYYFIVNGEEGVSLAATLGEPYFPEIMVINELTTVATAYAFANFLEPLSGEIRGDSLGLQIAAMMTANLVDIENGLPSQVLLNPPNANQTNALRATRSLANMIAAAIASQDDRETFFSLTTPGEQAATVNTLQGIHRIARHPANNGIELYLYSQTLSPFQPALFLAPDAWTLAVKVNQTGSTGRPFGGTANTVFDERGYAWINNNTVQGTPVSSDFIVVLKPNGMPADGEDGTPVSPISSGGILGAGLGITQSPVDGTIWMGNFGWGGIFPGPDSTGSVSQFNLDGTPVSPETGYQGGTERVQCVVVDDDGNVWSASYGNDKLVVFIGGDPNNSISEDVPCRPFGLAKAPNGSVWCAALGQDDSGMFPDATCSTPANVTNWMLVENEGSYELVRLSYTEVGKQNKGVDVDLDGYCWLASGGDDTVYRIAPEGGVVGEYRGGSINAPWNVRIDDGGDVWVANFGLMSLLPGRDIYYNPGLTKLAGPNSASGQPIGTQLTPATGYTLPSGGDPVTLSDGTPLYTLGQPGFIPFMRLVSTVPDRAGNIWATNNWKPNFRVNIFGPTGTDPANGDPGGDGVVIFIGVATPTKPGRTQ